jgi:hypothetical protein
MQGKSVPKETSNAIPVVSAGVVGTARLQTQGWVLQGLMDIKRVPGKQGKSNVCCVSALYFTLEVHEPAV